jgi:hypothetical protein
MLYIYKLCYHRSPLTITSAGKLSCGNFCATPIPCIDILLRILTGEVHVMARLSQMLGARLAGMVIGHVETTRVTRIPVGKSLCGV